MNITRRDLRTTGGRRHTGPALFASWIPVGAALGLAALLLGRGDAPVIAAAGRTIYADASRTGDGSSPASPLGSIQAALQLAGPGDTVLVAPGQYSERLDTVRSGTADAPITIRASSAPSPLVTAPGRVLSISHAYVRIEGLTLDGQYGPDDAVRIPVGGTGAALVKMEVRRSGRDCIDIGSPSDVLIEDSLVHHCLNSTDGRSDAHGIVAAAAQRLTIRGTEVHTFSGDAVQLDPSRSAPGWDELTIDDCEFWLAPLTQPENGFPAGTVTGENAIDTKTFQSSTRPRLVVRNSVVHGFRDSLITNAAAFNLKEHIDAVVDRVTVYDSEIAFRLRGPAETGARVRISNAVVRDVTTAFRYEDDIQDLRVWNVTVGSRVGAVFQRASSSGSVLDVRNLLALGTALPTEAATSPSNLAVDAAVFVDAANHDYRPRAGSRPIDRATPIAEVTLDRDGVARPYGAVPDVGAHEWCPGDCVPPRPARHVRLVR